MFVSAPSEKREIRPRSRSFMRACVTRELRAASAWVERFSSTSAAILPNNSERKRRFAASSGVQACASHTGAAFDLPLAHASPLVRWAKRACAVKMSRFAVACAFFWKA